MGWYQPDFAAYGHSFEAITRSNFASILVAHDGAELVAKKARYPDFRGIIGTPEVFAGLTTYADVGARST
ncbi:MAG TPA: hypothetical protein VIL85_18255 [Thermomicrobiales bacterium]